MRLSALEAGFLYLESPTTPMHVGSVGVFDGTGWHDRRGRLRIRALRALISKRIEASPRLRQYPVWPLGRLSRPHWMDDPGFDIDRHVRELRLPAESGTEQLMSAVEELQMALLDRNHPLWELWFVDGLTGGRVALVEKLHHALVDGIGGVDLAMMLLDVEPRAAERPPAGRVSPPGPSSRIPLLAETVVGVLAEPFELAAQAIDAATHPVRSFRSAGRLLAAGAAILRPPAGGGLIAGSSSLNRQVGPFRTFRVVQRSLSGTKVTSHALGGKVNDAILAAVAGAVRGLLESRGELGASPGIRVLVPVSSRRSNEHDLLGNKVTAMIVPLPVEGTSPPERFSMARAAVELARRAGEGDLVAALLGAGEHFPEPILAGVGRLVHHQPLVNLVVTNVPGPPIPLYLMGSQMLEVFPIVPLAGNLTVSIGILSYGDHLAVGLWADRGLFADLDVLAKGIDQEFDELDALTHVTKDFNR